MKPAGEDREMLERIASAIRETNSSTRSAIPVGPFAAFIDEEDATPWQSIAYPPASDAEAARDGAAIEELRRSFRAHQRGLRFELFDALYPRLIAALQRAGFAVTGRQPVMVCAPGDIAPAEGAPFEVQYLGPEDPASALAAFLRIQHIAFAEAASEADIQAGVRFLRRDMESGRLRCAVAFGGAGAGSAGAVSAAAMVGIGEVAELAGVATLPEARNQGAASLLSAALVRSHFARGGALAWLTAGEAAAGRVYARLGFRETGALQLNLEDRAERDGPARGAPQS